MSFGGLGEWGTPVVASLKPNTREKAELDCSLLQFIRGPHQAVAGTAPTSFNTAAAAFFSRAEAINNFSGQAHGVLLSHQLSPKV